jgi:hypothetical protein
MISWLCPKNTIAAIENSWKIGVNSAHLWRAPLYIRHSDVKMIPSKHSICSMQDWYYISRLSFERFIWLYKELVYGSRYKVASNCWQLHHRPPVSEWVHYSLIFVFMILILNSSWQSPYSSCTVWGVGRKKVRCPRIQCNSTTTGIATPGWERTKKLCNNRMYIQCMCILIALPCTY